MEVLAQKAVQEKDGSIESKMAEMGVRVKRGGRGRGQEGPCDSQWHRGSRRNRTHCLITLNFTQTVTVNNTTTSSYPLAGSTCFC